MALGDFLLKSRLFYLDRPALMPSGYLGYVPEMARAIAAKFVFNLIGFYISTPDGLYFSRQQGTKGNRLFINFASLLQRQQEVKIMERMDQLVVIHNQGQRVLANLHRRRHTSKM